LSHVIHKVAEAEAVTDAEGDMCGLVLREAVALPGSLDPITHARRTSEPGRSDGWPGSSCGARSARGRRRAERPR
jgi:hypothetical protein